MGTSSIIPVKSHPTSSVVDIIIDLTAKEKQIFQHLLQVNNHFNLHTQIRVAGGWVRDKLLGKECCDIDIALNNILGREFLEKVEEYSSAVGVNTERKGVTGRNPAKSKHLETARLSLFDVSIDFVNLRAEDYSENSRIPTMKFGTPKEDAFRRDLTINSLFYNIHTSSVEDFTDRGIPDLKAGKLVTPLPPKQTFLDDPLRVLRSIRFGARFGFVFDEDLKLAAAAADIRAAIAKKISRERVGCEIDLMLSGNQPTKAMMYVAELHLFWSVFSLPSEVEPPLAERCDRLCVSYMGSSRRLLELIGDSSFTDDQRRLCMYAALFLPFRGTLCRDEKGKKCAVVSYILDKSLKLKSSDAKAVIKLHMALHKFLSLIPFLTSESDAESIEVAWKKETDNISTTSKLRLLTGLLLIDIKDFWRSALLLSVLLYTADISCFPESAPSELEKRRELFKRVEDKILNLGLDKVWKMEPLLDGNDIMTILHLKSGPAVGEWKQRVFEWQLAHPSGTADACIDWMNENCSKRARTN